VWWGHRRLQVHLCFASFSHVQHVEHQWIVRHFWQPVTDKRQIFSTSGDGKYGIVLSQNFFPLPTEFLLQLLSRTFAIQSWFCFVPFLHDFLLCHFVPAMISVPTRISSLFHLAPSFCGEGDGWRSPIICLFSKIPSHHSPYYCYFLIPQVRLQMQMGG